MCGIAGLAGNAALGPGAVQAVREMTATLARRGPDGEGIHAWSTAVFGHRRLAIFDLSDAGRQPMLSPDGELGVVFNGAIYNFLDLRAELQTRGYRFVSHTDTEVLIHGYAEWGPDALVARLRGMFAFALWDNRVRKLFMVRDRLGVKPLLYAIHDGQLAFASTLPALQQTGWDHEVDPDAVLDFLEFGWVGDQRSILQGIHKVPAATIVEWYNGALQQREYWTPPFAPDRKAVSFDEATEQVENLLLEAVKLRLAADVPVAALLSGGIDSTLVCWAMAKLNANIKAFTVATPGRIEDESEEARQTAQTLGIPHEVVDLSGQQPPDLSDLLNAYGEPFACSSALGMLSVSRAVKPHATVLLTGDGGDDVFLGYTHHRNLWRAQKLANRLPSAAAATWPAARGLAQKIPQLRRAMHLVDYATGGVGAVTKVHDGLPFYQDAGILSERLAGRSFWHREIPQSFEAGRELLPRFLDYERRTRFVAEYMTKVDGGTMFYGIEARSPFLDHVLWEYAAGLPYDIRLAGGELKAVLRAIARKRVNPETARRRKQGFTVPVETWLTNGWRSQLEPLLESPVLERDGWFRPGALRNVVIKTIESGQAKKQLWYLLVLERWLRERVSTPCALTR